MRDATCLKSVAVVFVVAAVLLAGVPARGAAGQSAGAGGCSDAQTCLELLRDGIALIEAGRWNAASVLLTEAGAGLEGRPSHVRDLALAYVYLGVARLQVADADETRQWLAEAQMRDPTLQLDPAAFPGDVLDLWAEARDLGMLFVDTEPSGAEVSIDEVVRGRSPVGVAGLRPGEYRVTLAHAGYAGVSRVLSVAAGRTERLFVPMLPASGAADTRPRGAGPLTGIPRRRLDGGPVFRRRGGGAGACERVSDPGSVSGRYDEEERPVVVADAGRAAERSRGRGDDGRDGSVQAPWWRLDQVIACLSNRPFGRGSGRDPLHEL